ncbi:MAG TPA: hypothetical protein VNF73_05330 [Candidatus Saccharimonadales bacterium]|nr:hypothetical protein [Candidatus Saccharimonadales bacterium]
MREHPILARVLGLLLPAWFALWTIADVSHRFGDFFASDTRIYYRATQTWLAGGDPWSAAVGPFHFAGLPPTVQLFVPLTWLPEEVAVWLGFLVGVASAVAIVRMLRLPAWWLLFPPLAHGVIVANPHILLTALLLSGRPAFEAVASLLKIYAVVPLVGQFRVRGLILTAAGLIASFALAPNLWLGYLGEMAATTARLNDEAAGGFSAAIAPILLAPMAIIVLALAAVDRRAASWLAVPALWPASQFFTSTFAMPVLAGGGAAWFAAMLAIPSRGVVPIAIAVYAVVRLWQARREARLRDPEVRSASSIVAPEGA